MNNTETKKDIMEIAPYATVPAQVPEEEKAGAVEAVKTFLGEVRAFLYAAAGGGEMVARPVIKDAATRTMAAQIVARARAEVKHLEGVMKKPAPGAHPAGGRARRGTEAARRRKARGRAQAPRQLSGNGLALRGDGRRRGTARVSDG